MGSSVSSRGAVNSSVAGKRAASHSSCHQVAPWPGMAGWQLTLIVGEGTERSSGAVAGLLDIITLGRLVDLCGVPGMGYRVWVTGHGVLVIGYWVLQ